ncbi:winged helix-turn-helix domain-containing protein [uncultured Sphingomonas sp.]|uniref:winged helix-turn-helix domain-containing protein n=1 Tax=uncultured Sphingomonas sp. TaxID=158754 RepID=UPI0035CAE81B
MSGDISSLSSDGPIDLAKCATFRLGEVEVRPSFRQLLRIQDGQEEIVEPRIMQVLVTLAQAQGAIVTREDLVRRCWEGRIVGEDAINRAVSRVRRLPEGIAKGSFHIETLNKVGYRLIIDGTQRELSISQAEPHTVALRFDRRHLLLGGAAAATVASTAAWWALRDRASADQPDAEVAALMSQAQILMGQRDSQGLSQAVGLFREVTRRAPDYADGWGALALAYSVTTAFGRREARAAQAARSAAAAARAEAIEPGNGFAALARIGLLPRRGRWWQTECLLMDVLKRLPDFVPAKITLAVLFAQVGRIKESLPLWQDVIRREQPAPSIAYLYGNALWTANRLEEAEAALQHARELYPLHYAVWFTWAYFQLYTGRVREALAMLEDRAGRPPGFEDFNFDVASVVAKALLSGARRDIDHAVAVNQDAARRGVGFAENAMQFMAVLGRPTEAFAVADALFFDRGWVVPDVRFMPQQAAHTRLADRRTAALFLPSTAALRGDSRFSRLVEELGLSRYWQRSGSRPDFR